MTLRDLIPQIEAPFFAAQVNVSSGSKAFYRNLRRHPLFQDLCKLSAKPDSAKTILGHIADISKTPVDPRYENPLDAALAAYLTALEDTQSELASSAARLVADAKNCWWAAEASTRLRPIEPVLITCMPSEGKEIPRHQIRIGTASETKRFEEPIARKGMQFNQRICLVGAAG
jgi:hypothetical protein